MTGNNITSTTEPLQKTPVETLYNDIRNPKPEVEAKIRQLRIIYQLDPKKYTQQKKMLPYFVCGMFNPPYRKTENFAYTKYFVLDIDKISICGMDIDVVKEKIKTDERVLLYFASPSDDGIKVMFKLKDPCYESGLFSIFYKAFVQEFSGFHGLFQMIDSRTCDVTRACFMSMDPEAYYNPQALEVDLAAYVDIENPQMVADLDYQLKLQEEEQDGTQDDATFVAHDPNPDQEVMDKIKERLNPKNRKPKEEIPVFVPKILDDIMGDLVNYITDTGLEVAEVIDIQYGKKIRTKLGVKQAETNVFYGKRGFSIVATPKSGTNAELNKMVAELIETFIENLYS